MASRELFSKRQGGGGQVTGPVLNSFIQNVEAREGGDASGIIFDKPCLLSFTLYTLGRTNLNY